MIVREESDGSLVMITQNDHAKASGLCASHWGNALFTKPRPYDSCVRAAFLHDLAWLGEETSPRFNPATGRTINYLDVPNESQLNEYAWANDWLARRDPYTALLVNKHRTGIWQSRYGLMRKPHYPPRRLHPDIEAFVIRSHAAQQAAAATYDAHQVVINYILLQIWDLLSLYVCSNEHLKEECYEPVPRSYSDESGEGLCLTPAGQHRIGISPYPFDRPALDINIVYRRLPTSQFADASAFQSIYFNTAPQLATFTFFDPDAI